MFDLFTHPMLLAVLAIVLLEYGVVKAIYRLYLHPLASFPGPVLASITLWHQFYYNWFCEGLHSVKIKQWHEQYGPIIRIGPNELHFSDADAYRAIYTHHGLPKYRNYYKFMTEDSLVGRLDINENKRTRKIFAGFFSTSAARAHSNNDGILWTKANHLTTALRRLCTGQSKPVIVNITDLARCFTYDTLKQLALGSSDELDTTSPDFKPPFVVANAQVSSGIWFAQQFPLLVHIVRWLPGFLLSPSLLALRVERESCCREVTNRSRGFDGSPSPHPDHASICSQVIAARFWNRKIQISNYHLGLEIFDFFMAGTELPAKAISFGVFHVARNPRIIERLRQELFGAGCLADCNFQNLTALEKLPFLNAVVKETLRLGNLVPGRLPRVTPPEGLTIGDLHIPGRTVVGGSSHLIHMDPSIFPEPEKFVPERWLVNESGSVTLDKYMLAFSTGPRDCIGRELAFAEIRTVIACLVSYCDVELADPRDRFMDLTWRDKIVASYDRDVVVTIRGRD